MERDVCFTFIKERYLSTTEKERCFIFPKWRKVLIYQNIPAIATDNVATQVWLCDCIISKMCGDLVDQTKEIDKIWYVYVLTNRYLFSLE